LAEKQYLSAQRMLLAAIAQSKLLSASIFYYFFYLLYIFIYILVFGMCDARASNFSFFFLYLLCSHRNDRDVGRGGTQVNLAKIEKQQETIL